MGRKLLVVASLAWLPAIGAWPVTVAAQPTPTPAPSPSPSPAPQSAADLFKQGQELVGHGDFVTAVGAFQRALDMEPGNAEYKLALADAERQSNQCDKAIPRYKELIEAGDARAKAAVVQCPNAIVIEPPAPKQEIQLPAPPPEPKVITREGPPSGVTIGVIAGAGLCFGGAIGMYLAARGSDNDADEARSYADHESISARADRERVAAIVLAAGAAALGTYAVYRIKFKKSAAAEVGVAPTANGGAVMVRGSW